MLDVIDHRELVRALNEEGPKTGAELVERMNAKPLPLWRASRSCAEVRFQVVGRRYLRLDRHVEGYARLSPSIRREFLSYTLFGLDGQSPIVEQRAAKLRQDLTRISDAKQKLAREAMRAAVAKLPQREAIVAQTCFMMGGDVAYGMSHVAPRTERSTGKVVRGSDLDIIVVANDSLPDSALKSLDDAIYFRKHYLLVHPDYQEEIDYVVKRVSLVQRQADFDSFEAMVACKIMHESVHLFGNDDLFCSIKEVLAERDIPARLAALQARAADRRLLAEAALLEPTLSSFEQDYQNLFYTSDEGDEIY
jgi:hypothetical protein